MLEIKFDVTTLSTEQRQDLASFILGFPGKISEPLTSPTVYKQEFGRALRPAPANVQVHDFSPESPPLPEGASATPISAGAEVSSIAPEVIPETILTNPIVNAVPTPPTQAPASHYLTTLNTEQRQGLASFMLGFPGKFLTGLGNIEVHDFPPESPLLPEGASAAPISAGVEASSTAPEVTAGITSTNPIVNIPPVPQNANAAAIVAPQQINPVELDSEGLPWDRRIHASTKTKIASGSWKLARGVEPNVVEAVKAELRALMDINTSHNTGHVDHSPETRIPAPPIVSEVIIPQVLAGTTSIEEPVKSTFAANVVPAPASHYLMMPIRHGFVDFIEDITKLLVSKKLAQPEIIKACNDAGVAAPNLLAARQDLIPQVAKALDDIVASRI